MIVRDWTDTLRRARSWVDRYRWTFPNCATQTVLPVATSGCGLPTTFFIGYGGRIADVLLGPRVSRARERR